MDLRESREKQLRKFIRCLSTSDWLKFYRAQNRAKSQNYFPNKVQELFRAIFLRVTKFFFKRLKFIPVRYITRCY